ncbi:DNA-binding protein [Natrialbaceae archaeon GCM10025896]
MNHHRRLLAAGLLLVLTAGLCVHYGATYEDNWPYPTGDQLAEEPAGWDGERVLLFGEVQERTGSGLVMTVDDDAGEVARTITVQGTAADVERGGVVQVYGMLSERGTIQQAESVVVVNRNPGDSQYKLGTSALGVLLAAGLFLRYWGIEWRRLRFVRRSADDHGERDG